MVIIATTMMPFIVTIIMMTDNGDYSDNVYNDGKDDNDSEEDDDY